jgi:hypothetical protein
MGQGLGQAVGKAMGQGNTVSPAPPRFLEFLAGLLLPSACREHVLGDLHERFSSPLGYIADLATAVPAVIITQIRRATPYPFLLLEVLVVYVSFLVASLWVSRIDGPPDYSQLARFTAFVMAGLLLRDAYSARPSPSRLRLIASVYLTVYFSCGAQWIWQSIHPNSNPSFRMMTSLFGLFISSVLISMLRIWIEQLGKNRPRGAR